MNIAAYISRVGGVSYYRIQQPLQALRELGHTVKFIESSYPPEYEAKILARCDVVYIACPFGKETEERIEKVKKHLPNLPIVGDYDDNLLCNSPLNSIYRHTGRKDVAIVTGTELSKVWKDGEDGFDISRNKSDLRATRFLIKHKLDAVTSPNLKLLRFIDRIAPGKECYYLPNAINPYIFSGVPRILHQEEIRIGYTCGDSHYNDYHDFWPTVNTILHKYPNVHYYQFGTQFNHDDAPVGQYHAIPWMSDVSTYAGGLSTIGLDIGICHVDNALFNAFKSPLKWEEFASLGVATVCSKKLYGDTVTNNKDALVHNNKDEMLSNLMKLIEDQELRTKISLGGYDTVSRVYTIQTVAREYEQMFEEVITRSLHKKFSVNGGLVIR